jgi:hypothetical protein
MQVGYWRERQEERNVGDRIILKFILKKKDEVL